MLEWRTRNAKCHTRGIANMSGAMGPTLRAEGMLRVVTLGYYRLCEFCPRRSRDFVYIPSAPANCAALPLTGYAEQVWGASAVTSALNFRPGSPQPACVSCGLWALSLSAPPRVCAARAAVAHDRVTRRRKVVGRGQLSSLEKCGQTDLHAIAAASVHGGGVWVWGYVLIPLYGTGGNCTAMIVPTALRFRPESIAVAVNVTPCHQFAAQPCRPHGALVPCCCLAGPCSSAS